MFSLGAGGSSNDDDSPIDSVARLKSAAHMAANKPVKHTSFSEEVVIQQSANSESDLTSDVSDSAIEDDDDAEWEDDSGQASPQLKPVEPVTFQRTQSTTQLRPNRSALSLIFKGKPGEKDEAAQMLPRMQTSSSRRLPRASNGPSIGSSYENKSNLLRMAIASRSRLGPQGPSALPSAPHSATVDRANAHAEFSATSHPISIPSEPRLVKQQMVTNEITGSVMRGVLGDRTIKTREIKAAEALKRSATTAGELSALARERQHAHKDVTISELNDMVRARQATRKSITAVDAEAEKQRLAREFSDAELNRYFDPHWMNYNDCGW